MCNVKPYTDGVVPIDGYKQLVPLVHMNLYITT